MRKRTEKTELKKRYAGQRYGKILLLAAVLLLAVLLQPGEAQAAQEDNVWAVYAFTLDSDGYPESAFAAAGYVVDFGDSSPYQVYTNSVFFEDDGSSDNFDASADLYYFLMDLETGDLYNLEVSGYNSHCGMMILDFADDVPTTGILTAGAAKKGQEVEIIGLTYDDVTSVSGTINSYKQNKSGDDSWYVLDYSGSTDDFYFYPMALVDEDSNIVGMITSKGAYAMYSELPSSFPENLLTDYWWVLLIAAVVIVLVVAVAVGSAKGKKKAAAQTTPVAPQTPVTPQTPEPPTDIPIYPTTPVYPEKPEPQPVRPSPRTVTSLVGIQGIMAGRTYPIGPEGITIGRDPSNVIVYPADTKGISRKHCRLYFESDGGLKLVDCGSSYGTVLVGLGKMTPLQPVSVKPGDRFYIGSEKNGFELR
ncbi:MAG: FHA domain-containing protein [Lachnospiraceae bacterium]|nr:FHA domain-containing protein [Lachnospiraceae bacterium]